MSIVNKVYRVLNVHNDLRSFKNGKALKRLVRKTSIKRHSGIVNDLLGK